MNRDGEALMDSRDLTFSSHITLPSLKAYSLLPGGEKTGGGLEREKY